MRGRHASAPATCWWPRNGACPAPASCCGRRGRPAGNGCRDGAKAALRPAKMGGAFVSPACRVGSAVMGFTLSGSALWRKQSKPFVPDFAGPAWSMRGHGAKPRSRPSGAGIHPCLGKMPPGENRFHVRLAAAQGRWADGLKLAMFNSHGRCPEAFVATSNRRQARSIRVGSMRFVGRALRLCKRGRRIVDKFYVSSARRLCVVGADWRCCR